MLDLIGFLSWYIAWYDGLTYLRKLKNQADVVLDKLHYASNSKAGIIVNLAKDWKMANFPLWVYHGISILFKWMPAEQEDPLFSHVLWNRLLLYIYYYLFFLLFFILSLDLI